MAFRYNEEISVKNQYSMKSTNSAKYEIVFRGGKEEFSKNELLMQSTHPSVSQEYIHLEGTLGIIPLMLYQTFPFIQ